MTNNILKELHYQYRCLRLGLGFITGRFIHCNLQLTYRCNFKCRICDFWKTGHSTENELSLAQIKTIGNKLNTLGTLIVSLAGGEPLERKDIIDIIRILNECNHFPILITNGWYVTPELSRDLLNAGLQEISVSLDYISPEKHDAQRGMAGSWNRAVNALEMLNKARTDKRNRVHMISVLMDDNLDDIEELIKLARDIGVTYMVNLYSWNRGTKKPRLPGRNVTDHLLNLKRKYPEFITLTSYLEQMDKAISEGGIGQCQTGRLLMNIDNYGNVARCTETLDEPVGNLLTDSVRLINRRLRSVQANKECNKCWTSCRGFAECMFKAPRLRQFREFYCSVKAR
ncbi:MAG: hypothetical protein CVV64_00065 [Candidatus Wallbacteria bacterium HGW-Wallbacteria-1]|jgi:MoaA/NifB/PqqE/SkfB family radical SAM enzyme|uniref:Radical SAM core domain-containing protein n=1 Tax=Candidatus Wallbacteria bacterium HGW-Wallbacteria-1 TaxID=2013854 RepID=A0A2N1PU55_9BACT|nr:MAG: hypothetical protein CVV64_00065 [Candidatus Wallbacteria bacterium HGW-Wallbacteria-1]